MLEPSTRLVAVAVEGPAPKASRAIVDEEVIDVAEYYGSENFNACERVEYIQLKHSTVRTEKPWTLSELKRTLKRFAGIFRSRCDEYGLDAVDAKLRFRIVSNRPFGPSIVSGTVNLPLLTRQAAETLSLSPTQRKVFINILSFNGAENDYVGQRMSLRSDLNGFLAADDADAPVRLKDLVTQKALSHSAENNVIRRADLLMALEVTEDRLYPANSLIEIARSHPRKQELDFAEAICVSKQPVVIHAAGGMGKSILCTRLPSLLPPGSVAIVYDCFGNGSYRQAGRPRHNAQQALVQIANELAMRGLCDVLIPSNKVTVDQYFRAFEARLAQSSELVDARSQEAVICLIVDAADNAETAARELGEDPSFVRSLLRVPLPGNVRLVVLSRTERLELLDLPPDTVELKLNGFTEAESREHLRGAFPEATEAEAEEFHRLTSANPRVQAAALAGETSLPAVLTSLGVTPRSVDDNIATLLERAIKRLLDSTSEVERGQIETIAMAIATLRPFVPLDVLAKTANVDIALVESFAADLGRPLLISGGALQFRDEPTETWFRERYRPRGAQLQAFVSVIESLSADHPYAASTLPQLLLESGDTDRLIRLALSGEALPKDPSEQRTIEVQRLVFALKAALRSGMYLEASKLALKAGQEVSGAERQFELLAENLDLVGTLWPPHRIRELAGTHSFSSDWLGARHVYEAELFASLGDGDGEARSQSRMANDWLFSWSSQPANKRHAEDVTDVMKMYMADTAWRLDGPNAAIFAIARWRPKEVHYKVAKLLARRALDTGRQIDLQNLASASASHVEMLLAFVVELNRDGLSLEKTVLRKLITDLKRGKLKQFQGGYWHREDRIEPAIVAVAEMAIRTRIDRTPSLAEILDSVLANVEPHHFGVHDRDRREVLLRAFAIRCYLKEEPASLDTLLSPAVQEQLKKNNTSDDRTMREFREFASSLLPWHVLFVKNLADPIPASELQSSVSVATEKLEKSYRNYDGFVSDDISVIWLAILASQPNRSEEAVTGFMRWASVEGHCRFIPTWVKMARISAISQSMRVDAYTFAQKARSIIEHSEDLDASSRADSYASIARSILNIDKDEARRYFDEAIRVASKLGYEASQRWMAILDLADGATRCSQDAGKLAYRVGRCAELVHQYDSKHFDWEGTIHAMNGLSPTSGVAIVSRWHDRRFGDMNYTLPVIFNDLISRNLLRPNWACSLFWFFGRWDYDGLLQKMLIGAPPNKKRELFVRALRPLLLQDHGRPLWDRVRRIALEHGLPIEQIDERIALEEVKNKASSDASRQSAGSYSTAPDDGRSVAAIWKSLALSEKLYSSHDLREAHRLWQSKSTPRRHLSTDRFINLAIENVAPQRVVDFIRAVADCPSFEPWELMTLFQRMPASWRSRLSVSQSLQEAAKAVAKRFCDRISNSRFQEANLFTVLSDVSGLSHRDIAKEVLAALADVPVLDDPYRLFSLASLLVQHLNADQCAESLSFGLNLLEEQLGNDTGDGEWGPLVEPDDDIEEAMAGFLFAKLASPVADIRWQAAHVVVDAVITDDAGGLVRRLIRRDQLSRSAPYADPNLVFYELHGRQWLLMAFARLSKQFPRRLSEHLMYFVETALNDDHILIRHFARETALHAPSERTGLSAETRQALSQVNVTKLIPLISKSYERSRDQLNARDRADDHFVFGYDMDRYWFEPLDRAFNLPIGTAMSKAQDTLRQPWASSLRNKWKWQDDARAQRGVFRERETWASHSSYPSTDSLNFYVSYHALMKAAGELLKTNPPHKDPEDQDDGFVEWLKGHLLTRSDGFWLSDGRDPEPLGLDWADTEGTDHEWRFRVQRSDFVRCLSSRTDRITLCGNWSTVRGRRAEHVTISSRLVSPDAAAALQRALQSAGDPHGVNFPDEEDIDDRKDGFRVVQWLNRSTIHRQLDNLDRWSGSVEFEKFDVAKVFDENLLARIISDGRSWHLENSNARPQVAWSDVWGAAETDENRDSYRGHGAKLDISAAFLEQLLSATPYKMIVRILIDRKLNRSPYEREKEDYTYVPPYFLYHVFDHEITGDRTGGDPRTRRQARR